MGIYAAAGQSADNEILKLTAQLAAVTAERDRLRAQVEAAQRAQ